jgi:hypothetical protein
LLPSRPNINRQGTPKTRMDRNIGNIEGYVLRGYIVVNVGFLIKIRQMKRIRDRRIVDTTSKRREMEI